MWNWNFLSEISSVESFVCEIKSFDGLSLSDDEGRLGLSEISEKISYIAKKCITTQWTIIKKIQLRVILREAKVM